MRAGTHWASDKAPDLYKRTPEYLECIDRGLHFDTVIGYVAQGGGVKILEYTAAEQEQINEIMRETLHNEPTLSIVFPEYQQWRADGGLVSQTTTTVLKGERGRFDNYCKDSLLFKTPISQLDDTQAIEFLKELQKNGVKYNPRLECKKTLSQMASFLREKRYRHGALLFQKLKVSMTAAEKQARKFEKYKYYHPTKEIPQIFKTLHRLVDEARPGSHEALEALYALEAAATLYWGAFRNVDIKGNTQPEVAGLRWENIGWESFKITYFNTKAKKGGAWCSKHPHPDLKPYLYARWVRHGRPSSGRVFCDLETGEVLDKDHDFGLDKIIHEAGIEKQRGRKLHAFRHSAAVAAASGVWSKPGEPSWTKDQVAKLLNDTTDAVQIYFDIVDESLQELASNSVSQLEAWGLTPPTAILDAHAHVDSHRPASKALPPLGGASTEFG